MANSWIEFLKANKGSGKTMVQLSVAYRASKSQKKQQKVEAPKVKRSVRTAPDYVSGHMSGYCAGLDVDRCGAAKPMCNWRPKANKCIRGFGKSAVSRMTVSSNQQMGGDINVYSEQGYYVIDNSAIEQMTGEMIGHYNFNNDILGRDVKVFNGNFKQFINMINNLLKQPLSPANYPPGFEWQYENDREKYQLVGELFNEHKCV